MLPGHPGIFVLGEDTLTAAQLDRRGLERQESPGWLSVREEENQTGLGT
jgi:hypothetical protein